MFDTNIFNHIVEGKISLGRAKEIHEYFITHIQRDELNAAPNEKKRNKLLETLKVINPFPIPTESAIVGISRCDLSKCSEEDGLSDRIFEQLEKEKPHHRGNKKDALIGETAIKTGITLVTDDVALRETVKELGGVAIHLRDFLKVTEDKS